MLTKYKADELDQKVLGVDGKPAQTYDIKKKTFSETTIRETFKTSLNGVYQGEQLTFEERMQRYQLLQKFSDAGDITLEEADQKILEHCLKMNLLSPEQCGFIFTFLQLVEKQEI